MISGICVKHLHELMERAKHVKNFDERVRINIMSAENSKQEIVTLLKGYQTANDDMKIAHESAWEFVKTSLARRTADVAHSNSY